MEKTEAQEREIDLLIAGYLSGSASEKEVLILQEWINESSSNLVYFNKLRDAWIISGGLRGGSTDQEARSWSLLKNRLNVRTEDHHPDRIPGIRKAAPKYIRIAAACLLMIGSGSLLTLLFTNIPGSGRTDSSQKTIEISTPLGARSTIRMPDSTVIWLNAGTTISYSDDYGKVSRTVEMSGEAYFSVAKDMKHPFIVNTQGLSIRALGTRFNVKAYPEEKTVSATLEEGKIDVKIEGTDEKSGRILMNPKDKFIYDKESKQSGMSQPGAEEKNAATKDPLVGKKQVKLYSNVRTELYTSWKDARWIIYREPLNTLAPMLERRYNLKIIFEDSQLLGYKFSGTVENETVDQIMNALKLTAPLDYKITRDTIRLTLDTGSRDTFKRMMNEKN